MDKRRSGLVLILRLFERKLSRSFFVISVLGLSSFLFPTAGFSQYYNLGAFWRSQGCTGVAYVQEADSGEVATGPTSASVTMTPQSGDLLVAAIAYQAFQIPLSAAITATVSDSLGNTWNAAPPVVDGNYGNFNIQLWFASGVTGGSSDTITLNQTQTSFADIILSVVEYSGIAATNSIDVSSGIEANEGDPVSLIAPGAVTATAGCDIAVSAFTDFSYQPSASSGFISRISDGSLNFLVEDNLSTGTRSGSSVNESATLSPADSLWVATQAAFRVNNYVFNVPAPTKLAFTSSAISTTTWQCSPVTVQLQNASSVPQNTETNVSLALSGSNAKFYSDSACTEPLSTAMIWASSNSQTFYAQFSGSPATVIVTPNGYSAITQTETITLNPETWIGGAGCNELWSTGACWESGTAPTNSQVAHFDANCTTNCAVTLNGNVSTAGVWLHSAFTGSLSQSTYSLFSGYGGLRVDGGTFNLNTGTYTDFNGIYLSGGTFNANSGNLEPYTNWVNNGGTFNGGTSTLNPGADFTIYGPSTTTFYAIDCAVDSFTVSAPVIISTNLTIASNCALATNNYPITLGGNWTNNGTYYTGYSGTDIITFAAGANHTITGTNSFTGLVMDNSSVTTANTITFPAGKTTTINNNYGITLKGNTTNNLTVTSSSTTKFTLTATATTTGSPIGNHLTVSYSKATNTEHAGTGSSISNTTGWVSP